MSGLDPVGVSAAAEALCPACGKPIHALDGAMSSGGEPMRHTDCERAARIDYAAAFDILYQRALANQRTVNALVEVTTQEDGEPWEHDGLLMRLYSDDSTSWSTYESCVLAVAGSPADERASTSDEEFTEAAWGLIANAYGGNWSDAPDEWHGAACRWRDEYTAGATARIPASPADERLREARDRWRERARDLEAQLHRANDELVQIADYSPSEVANAIDSTRAAIKDALAAGVPAAPAPTGRQRKPITAEEWAECQPQAATAFPVAPPATGCDSCGDESVAVSPGECCAACRRAHERLEPAAPVFDQRRLVDVVAFVNRHAEGPCGCDGDSDDPCDSCRALALLASWDAAGVSAEAAPDDEHPIEQLCAGSGYPAEAAPDRPEFTFRTSSHSPRWTVTCKRCGWRVEGDDPGTFAQADAHECGAEATPDDGGQS